MRKCLVTGASGHLGVALIKTLKENGEYVKVLIRNKDCLPYISEYVDEIVYGDISDKSSLYQALLNVDVVFHSAALITIGREKKALLKKVNIDGTKNIIDACKDTNVEKLIYISSAHAIDFQKKAAIIKEKDYLDIKKIKGNYAKSKAQATNLVRSATSDNLATVICMPSALIGPYAYKDSPFNSFLTMYSNNHLRIYFKGEYNFIDVRDAAYAIYQASIKGASGASYILSGEIMTIKNIFKCLAPSAGIKCPKIKIPLFLLKAISPICELYYYITKQTPLFSYHTLYTLNSNANFDNQKAINELNLSVRPTQESLIEHLNFIKYSVKNSK